MRQNTGSLDVIAVTCITTECLTTERKTSEEENASEVKHKVSLNYEKLELENKLAEMNDAILSIKNRYVDTASMNSSPSASCKSRVPQTPKSQKSACSTRSG